jgi:hypothetical protein
MLVVLTCLVNPVGTEIGRPRQIQRSATGESIMRRILVLVLFFVFVFSAVMIGQAQAGEQQVDRPFTMHTYEWRVSEVPTANCPFGEAVIEGYGTATHLGAVTIQRTHCFSPFNNPPIYNGHWEATAANGDRVWGSYTGTLIPTVFDPQGNPIRGQIISPYTVEGGTGRFANASGGGMTTADYDLVTNTGGFVTNGRLEY